MFIFGAGASFDSDPSRPAAAEASGGAGHRPPLAAQLFNPDSDAGRSIVARADRAAPLLMRLRIAVRGGQDVEEVLEQIVTGPEADRPLTASQLLAFRVYLAEMLRDIPDQWAKECQYLTNYILMLDEVDRWRQSVHGSDSVPVVAVTFNYDTLLEDAAGRALGMQIRSISDYFGPALRLYKPHGSVSWRQAAWWDQPPNQWLPGRAGLDKAIRHAKSLNWLGEFSLVRDADQYQDSRQASKIWLPALSIPARRKSTFSMPDEHLIALKEDLSQATTVIAVGWRARERHFLRLLQDAMPRATGQLIAVAENEMSARETVNELWQTGRFGRYAIAGSGFTDFVATIRSDGRGSGGGLYLQDVLAGAAGSWVTRAPGGGLGEEDSLVMPDPRHYEDL